MSISFSDAEQFTPYADIAGDNIPLPKPSKMQTICEKLKIQPGTFIARRNSTWWIALGQWILNLFKKGDHYQNTHMATVVSINAPDSKNLEGTITLLEACEFEGLMSVIVRSLNNEQFQHYINSEAGQKSPSKKKGLAILNHEVLTPLVNAQTQKMAAYYTHEAEEHEKAKKLLAEAHEKVERARNSPKHQSIGDDIIQLAHEELAQAKKMFQLAQRTGYAVYRLFTSPFLSSKATHDSRARTMHSYQQGHLMNANGTKRTAAICSEVSTQILLLAQMEHIEKTRGITLTEGDLKPLQNEGPDTLVNLDPGRVTPRKFTRVAERIGFNIEVLTLDRFREENAEYEAKLSNAV